MESMSKSKCFKVIEDQIKDGGVVTYKWLSIKLQIHNTIAKQFLQEFYDNLKDKSKYAVTLVVYARKDNGDLLLSLVKEEDFPDFKNSSIKVINDHIYSIQTADSIFKPDMIYNIDKATCELKQLSLSSIKYNREVIRKTKSAPSIPIPEVVETKKLENSVKPTVLVSPKKNKSEFEPELIKENDKKDSKKAAIIKPLKNQTSISTLFQKQAAKPVVKKEKNENNSEQKSLNGDSNENNKKTEESKKNSIESQAIEKLLITDKIAEKIELKAISQKVEMKNTEKSKAKKNKSKKSNQKGKKMKRIIIQSDSSSNSEASEDENHISEPDFDDMPEPEPEPESPKKEKESPATVVTYGKKRKRKVVEKTMLDDSGFLHTSKEVIYESCSSDENEKPVQNNENVDNNKRQKLDSDKNVKAKNKKEEVPKNQKQKTKQSSLMSFFQKSQKA